MENKEPIKIEDLLDFKFISNLKYSPDGQHAVFAVSRCDKDSNKYCRDLYVLDTVTNEVRQLTSSQKAGKPVWWDDRTIIFPEIRNEKDFKSVTDEDKELTVLQKIHIDGGEAFEALRIEKSINELEKIDERHACVTYGLDPRKPNLEGLDSNQKAEALKKAKEEKDYEVIDEIPYWFNGRGFTNGCRNCIGIMDMETGLITQIPSLPSSDIGSFKIDGDGILFSTSSFANGKRKLTSSLARYEIKTRKTETLISDERYDFYFFERINGKLITLAVDLMGKYGLNENPCFYELTDGQMKKVLDEDTSPSSNVIGDCTLGGGENLIVEDGNLFYNVLVGSRTTIRRLDSQFSSTDLISDSRSVDFFDIHGNDIIFCSQEPGKLQELYHLDVMTGKITQSTHINEPYYSSHAIATVERLNLTNDGTMIDGFVMKPIGFNPSSTYPCILDIHGGPKCAYGDIFFHEMQVWAAKGYFVIFCNPRGGDGRGNEFGDIRGKYGTIDYDDLMAFTDAAINAFPQIDSSRMGVTGGSYGGFMTNWIIGHTDRFKAAASQRSISNWISMANTTDIGYYFSEDQNGGATAWNDVDRLWFHSPLKYADKVKTPTLFIHSDNDYRCWMAEGLQMFTALKIHGVEARMCLFHGETHELSRSGKPLHRIRRLNEMTNWFEYHLK